MDVGAPHLLTEGALPVERKSRLTTDADSMGFAALARRYVALHLAERPHRVFRRRCGFLSPASPCPRVFCGVPYGRPEKTTLPWTTTFLPNSATRTDARARPYGLLCSSPARGFAAPTTLTTSRPAERRPSRVESRVFCVIAPTNPHGPILPARCLTGLRRSTWLRDTEVSPCVRWKRSRSCHLFPAKLSALV